MTTHPNYCPAQVDPAISAYYHAPPLWVGTKPIDEEIETAPEAEFIKDVYRTELSQGIRVRVRRDGAFIFDCSAWEPGGITEIPGYEVVGGKPIPREVTEADDLTQQKANRRTQLLTVHIACLGTAFGGGMRQDLLPQPSSMMSLLNFEHNDLLAFLNMLDPRDSYAYNNLILFRAGPGLRITDYFRRRIEIPVETIDKSFRLLQKILDSSHKNIIDLIELLYKSVYNYTCHQFAESLILSWAVCESLLNKKWSQYIEAKRAETNSAGMSDDATRINNDRKKRLEGVDFTASMMSEMLELSDIISYDLFYDLNAIRKARNNWLHSLKDVTMNDARKAIKTARDFLSLTAQIEINLQVGLDFSQRFYKKDFENLN